MGKLCPGCGMESDTDKVCSWCSKDLAAAPAKGKPEQPAPASAAAKPTPAVGPAARPARQPEPVKPTIPVWACVVAAGVLTIGLAIFGNFMAARKAAAPPPEPAQWKTVTSMTKLLTLQAPENWKFVTAGSSASYEQVDVTGSRFCAVRVRGSGTKGSMGDIMGASSNLARSNDLERRPEGKLHAFLGTAEKKSDPSYEEIGSMAEATFAGMPAAYSEYSAVRKIGLCSVKVKGWRMSCSGGDLGYDIRAEAPEKQWESFQPHAKRILGSCKLGSAQ